MLKHFTRNTAGRDLLVGDVHGFFTKLQAALEAVDFNPAKDRLFSVGDLVDRGPESARVLEWLSEPWFHAVRGNHEAWLLDYHVGRVDPGLYGINGGAWAIAMTPAERLPYVDAVAALPLAIELETEGGLLGLVHAECPVPDWDMLRRALEPGRLEPAELAAVETWMLWNRQRIDFEDRSEVAGVLAVVVGHTPVDRPTVLGNHVYIDTGAWLPARRANPLLLLDAATMLPAELSRPAA